MLNTNKDVIYSIFEKQQIFFNSGKAKSLTFRKESLLKLKQSIIEHQKDIHIALDLDLGKSKELVDRTEIGRVISEIDFTLENLETWMIPEKIPAHHEATFTEAFIEHESFGVSYIIGPFNYPINLVFSPLIGAIAGGNTAIIKPSESVPATAIIIEKIIRASFNEEYIAVIQGGREENENLLNLPFDFIFFTGSPEVGKIVMTAAAKHLTPVILELGGKSPFIVLSDANLDRAVEMLTFGRFSNSGQTCIAPDYMLVHETIKDELLNKLIEKIKATIPNVDSIGKLVSSNQVKKIVGMLQQTKGEIVYGGQVNSDDRQIQATVVNNVAWDDSLMREELFAPVLPVLSFTDIDIAIAQINKHHPKPLAAYVFTNDIEQGRKITTKIPSGDAVINSVMQQVISPYLPFGGIGKSGMGEYHGHYSFLAFTHRKSVVINK